MGLFNTLGFFFAWSIKSKMHRSRVINDVLELVNLITDAVRKNTTNGGGKYVSTD